MKMRKRLQNFLFHSHRRYFRTECPREPAKYQVILITIKFRYTHFEFVCRYFYGCRVYLHWSWNGWFSKCYLNVILFYFCNSIFSTRSIWCTENFKKRLCVAFEKRWVSQIFHNAVTWLSEYSGWLQSILLKAHGQDVCGELTCAISRCLIVDCFVLKNQRRTWIFQKVVSEFGFIRESTCY